MTDDEYKIDFIDRDPNNINDILLFDYSHVIAEPDGTHSGRCLWINSKKCYYCNKECCYSIWSFVCGLQLALFWGCTMACIAFNNIWYWMPMIRFYKVNMHVFKKWFKMYLATMVGPFVESAGLFFDRIHVVNSESGLRRSVYSFKLNDEIYKNLMKKRRYRYHRYYEAY